MNVLTSFDFERYMREPDNDEWLRAAYRIPADSYYAISVWPTLGILRMERSREIRLHKISKSDQQIDTSHEPS